VPSKCAELLHAGSVDLGLIPSIEYHAGDRYYAVPDVAIASNGEVASVALFTKRPFRDIRSVALDDSSRTSATLTRVLFRRAGLSPAFVVQPPVLEDMLRTCDAALLIGDIALFADAAAAGVRKIDLGVEWTCWTGLPFVWAFWAGRRDAAGAAVIRMLRQARDLGVGETARIGREYFPADPEKAAIADRYLRENIAFGFGDTEREALQRFYGEAAAIGAIPQRHALEFFARGPRDAGVCR
jgi:chorismate dehydratase